MHVSELPIAPRWTGDYTHDRALGVSPPPGVPMPLVDKRVASLREENARLHKEVEELRMLLQATQVLELGHSLVRYVLDVLCAMLSPQRGQALIVAGADLLDRDNPISAGPLQMALERPSLQRALEGQPSQVATPYESTLWLPITQAGRVAAVLCLRRHPTAPFTKRDQEVGVVLCSLLISALQSGRREFELYDDQEALRVLTSTLAARIKLAGGQLTAMAGDARQLAQRFHMDPEGCEAVRLGAILHDIGTVDLADSLLEKVQPLTGEEVAQLREHPSFGAEIARQIPGIGAVLPLIRHHHERWDGTGYPQALAGDAIPFGARIIAIVDAFYAMTSPRAYRPARSQEAALAELLRQAGSQFDRLLVEEYARMLRQAADITDGRAI